MAGMDLGKQIGPLPLGAWIAVVAGGLGIALYSRNDSGTSVEIVEDVGTPEGVADGTVGGWTPTNPVDNSTEAPITNNDEWGNRSINWLIAQGYDPSWAYSAITKALAGGQGSNKLGVREYALWRAALAKWGAPPYPVNVPPPGSLPKPPTPDKPGKPHVPNPGRPPWDVDKGDVTTQPKPGLVTKRKHRFRDGGNNDGKCRYCKQRANADIHQIGRKMQPGAGTFKYVTVKNAPLPGSTLKSLAKIYYGDASKWNLIYQANRKGIRRADGTPGLIENPNRLHAGWRLIIPR